VEANAEEEDLTLMMPLLTLLLSRKKRVRSTTLFTPKSTFDLLIPLMFLSILIRILVSIRCLMRGFI